ncbi:hypothetical protein [Pseudobutyrivibrio xylanivorans]|uniref:Chromosome segregation ATPase n=1 Tax=Pseudobutyrivibrio xylanivorans TaxID=185007 RepID=A0A1G5S2A1_PSEXY|nr:hypothetical protein [Pseudobutyrivibrio xylanivorans]SCZ79699.1 hypothetical protein SAMN02910350_01905 [Pseudobutyrivibrio xylanivorans]
MDKWGKRYVKVLALGGAIVTGITLNSTDAFAAEADTNEGIVPVSIGEQQDEKQTIKGSEIIQDMEDAVDIVEGDAVAEESYLTKAEDAIDNGEMDITAAEELIQNGKDVLAQATEKNDFVKKEFNEVVAETQAANEEFKKQAEVTGLGEFATKTEAAESNREKIEIVSEAEAEASRVYKEVLSERNEAFTEFTNYENQKEALDKQKVEIDAEWDDAERKYNAAKEKVDYYNEQIKEANQQYKELLEQLKESEKLQSELLEIINSDDVPELMERYEEVNEKIASVQAEIEENENDLAGIYKIIEENQKIIDDLQEEYDEYIKTLEIEKRKCKELAAEVQKIAEETENARQEKDDLMATIESTNDEMKTMSVEIAEYKEQMENNLAVYGENTEEEINHLADLEAQYKELEEKHDAASEKYPVALERYDQLRQEYYEKEDQQLAEEESLAHYENINGARFQVMYEAQATIEQVSEVVGDFLSYIESLNSDLSEYEKEKARLKEYIDKYESAKEQYQNELNKYAKLNEDILEAEAGLKGLGIGLSSAEFELSEVEEMLENVGGSAFFFDLEYADFMEEYNNVKENYDALQEKVDALSSFIEMANAYKDALSNETAAKALVERSEKAFKEVTVSYNALVKIIEEYKSSIPTPEPIHVPTEEEVWEIIEENMWTKDPSEYSHEEIVKSLECLAYLQKVQLQDPAMMELFLEAYNTYHAELIEQVEPYLKMLNISFDEVEAIFMRVIFG